MSRYMRELPNRPSQTWRTFVANHLGQFECNTQMLSPDVPSDDLADASPSGCRPLSSDQPHASSHCALVDGRVSVRPPGLGLPGTRDHLRDPAVMAKSAGRAPPDRILCNGRTAARGTTRVKVDQCRPTRQTATVTRVRPLRVANRDRYERHPTVGGVRLICGGSLCVGESRTIGIAARHTPNRWPSSPRRRRSLSSKPGAFHRA